MDACSLWSLVPSWQQLGVAIGVLYAAAKLTTIAVHTPPQNTTWGKIYHWIEVFALVVGHVKETGLLPPTPRVDQAVEQFAGPLEEALKTVAVRKVYP